MVDVEKICLDLIDLFVVEVKKDDNMDKIKLNVLNPCIDYLVKQFYPYIITTCIIFILTFVLAITILYILVTNKGVIINSKIHTI